MYARYRRSPRGRMHGHGGRRPGLLILGILGLIGFAPLVLAVVFGLAVGALGVIGGLISAAAGILSAFPAAFSGGSVAAGILIGLLLYIRNRNREDSPVEQEPQCEEPQCDEPKEEAYYPSENYRSFGN